MTKLQMPPAGENTSATDTLAAARFFNRDLSWLDFNYRVLHEAMDGRNPLLERLKFLAIFASNNDINQYGYVGRIAAGADAQFMLSVDLQPRIPNIGTGLGRT